MLPQDAQKDNSEVLRVSQSSPLQLRDYQSECVTAIKTHFASPVAQEGCLATLPTGSGKSLVIASLAHDAALQGDRVLCVTPTRELCRQNADKVLAMFPDAELGIFSAGLNRRDTDSSILVGTINSIYDRADELTVSGPIDLAVIDECHRIPHGMNQANGMYNRLLTDLRAVNPSMRICGTTATPYRLSGGLIVHGDHFLKREVYRAEIGRLWRDRYLCPVLHKHCQASVDTDGLHRRGGEFIDAEQEALFAAQAVIERTTDEILERTQERNSVLLFACTVKHAELVRESFAKREIGCGIVHGSLSTGDRESQIAQFTGGQVRFLVNVGVLTEGFDHPAIDAVVMLRATASPGLYSQCVGRGLRLHESKENCLLLDFGQNIERHGTIDDIRSPTNKRQEKRNRDRTKVCIKCREVNQTGTRYCTHCGHEFPHVNRGIINYDRYTSPIKKHFVAFGRLRTHVTQKGETCLRIDYLDQSGRTIASDYLLLLSHQGRAFAAPKWAELCDAPMPYDINIAKKFLTEAGRPTYIEVAKNKKGFVEVLRRIRGAE